MNKMKKWGPISNAVLLVIIILILIALYVHDVWKFYNPVIVIEHEKPSVVIDHIVKNDIGNDINKYTGRKQVVIHKIGVPILLQIPKFPTGCEAISLLMVLRYYGFGISDDALIDGYLKYWSEDYPVGFRGDPRSDDGGMMWPPALVDTANAYLDTQDTNRRAEDVSGTNFDVLMEYVDKNIPVIVWVTERFSNNLDYDGVVFDYDEKEYSSHYGSHCIVITGYDDTNDSIIINNPQVGEETIEKYQLWAVYDSCGKLAVIIS